ncbi:MAG: hypothetical protein WBM59_05130, partial [Sedimenticolaceae bacterium]
MREGTGEAHAYQFPLCAQVGTPTLTVVTDTAGHQRVENHAPVLLCTVLHDTYGLMPKYQRWDPTRIMAVI